MEKELERELDMERRQKGAARDGERARNKETDMKGRRSLGHLRF